MGFVKFVSAAPPVDQDIFLRSECIVGAWGLPEGTAQVFTDEDPGHAGARNVYLVQHTAAEAIEIIEAAEAPRP